MSHRKFVFSDGHFHHSKIYRFVDHSGARLRPWADSAEEGDEMMIEAWNSVVRPVDTVLHLGDVAIARKGLKLLERMNGRKILIRGNHDIFKLRDYAPYFEDIRGDHKQGRSIVSHYPIHPDSIPHWAVGNIHGHTHSNHVTCLDATGARVRDTRFFNASVEAMGLKPIELEEIIARMEAAQAECPPPRPWWELEENRA